MNDAVPDSPRLSFQSGKADPATSSLQRCCRSLSPNHLIVPVTFIFVDIIFCINRLIIKTFHRCLWPTSALRIMKSSLGGTNVLMASFF
jgi:hypothetical protein